MSAPNPVSRSRAFFQCPQCRHLSTFPKDTRWECPRCCYPVRRYALLPRGFPDLFPRLMPTIVGLVLVILVGDLALALQAPSAAAQFSLWYYFVSFNLQLVFFLVAARYYRNKIRFGLLHLQNAALQANLETLFVPAVHSKGYRACQVLLVSTIWAVQLLVYGTSYFTGTTCTFSITGEVSYYDPGLGVAVYTLTNFVVVSVYAGFVGTLIVDSIFFTRFLLFPTRNLRKVGLDAEEAERYRIKIYQQVYDRRFLNYFTVGLGAIGSSLLLFGAYNCLLHPDVWYFIFEPLIGLVYAGGAFLFYVLYYRPVVQKCRLFGLKLAMGSYALYLLPKNALVGPRRAGAPREDWLETPLLYKIFVPDAPLPAEVARVIRSTREFQTLLRPIPATPRHDSNSFRYATWKLNVNFIRYYVTCARTPGYLCLLTTTRRPRAEDVREFTRQLPAPGPDLARDGVVSLRSTLQLDTRYCLAEAATQRHAGEEARTSDAQLRQILRDTPDDGELVEELLFYYKMMKSRPAAPVEPERETR